MPTEEQIRSQIREFVLETYVFDENANVDDTDSLQGNEIVDSAGVLNLIMFLEETFSLSVGEDEVTPANMDSIAGMTRFVMSKLGDPAE